MSRRSGQVGTVIKAGGWYRVRFRIDIPDQYERVQKSVKICPVKGAGLLTKPERERRATEIVEQFGANSEEHFKKVAVQSSGLTFREQATRWLFESQTRKRNPVRPSTLVSWRSALDKHILPALGDTPLADVDNGAVKKFVNTLCKAGLKPSTVANYVLAVKLVVASAVDEHGTELYPRTWKSQFLDMPIIEADKQHTPCFTSEQMTKLVASAPDRQIRMFYILAGATGMRIGELLGLEINKHFADDFSTIRVQQKLWQNQTQDYLKTQSGKREIDLCVPVVKLLKEYIGDRTSGFLFRNRKGKPFYQSSILNGFLHPALVGNPENGCGGITGEKAGAHAFRRFRNTYLRNKTSCPDGIIKYWLGHSLEGMGDLYDKIKREVEFRKMKAEEAGVGFELPGNLDVVPSVPRNPEQVEVVAAA